MEVLGVVPIDPEQYMLIRPTPDTGYVELIADRSAPTGEPVRRVIRVDACHGQISQHRVESIDGAIIAVARLDKYERDPSSPYLLPRFIQVEWPQANAEMTFHLRGRIQTDSQRLAMADWSVPGKAGYTQLTIGQPVCKHAGNIQRIASLLTALCPLISSRVNCPIRDHAGSLHTPDPACRRVA